MQFVVVNAGPSNPPPKKKKNVMTCISHPKAAEVVWHGMKAVAQRDGWIGQFYAMYPKPDKDADEGPPEKGPPHSREFQ